MNRDQKEFGLSLLLRGAGIYILIQAIDIFLFALAEGIKYYKMYQYAGHGSGDAYYTDAPYVFFNLAYNESYVFANGLGFIIYSFFGLLLFREAEAIARRICQKAYPEPKPDEAMTQD